MTNEQALFVSRNRGESWELACGGRPAITLEQGTSFASPSAVTHAWVFEPERGGAWLYYTVNQPFTWGAERPSRSTGGGEIRRVRLHRTEAGEWHTAETAEVVWGFQQPLPDGAGGWCTDIRVVSWNGALRCSNGVWLMPVGGRSSVMPPRGEFARLNRIWLLASRDAGETWTAESFVAGGDDLCVAEPTIVETGTAGEIICLMRVQYGTGNELYQTRSGDYGRTWSVPVGTGLPNADTQGVKPFLHRDRSGRTWLIQTNEHASTARTNLAVFMTEDDGLRSCRWRLVRTLHIGHLSGWWPGACYGWLAEDPCEDALLAAYAAFEPQRMKILFQRLPIAALLDAPPVEPNGIRDEHGDDVPQVLEEACEVPPPIYRFESTRGRLIATGMETLAGPVGWVKFAIRMGAPPPAGSFRILAVATRNGRDICAELSMPHAGGLNVRAAGESRRIALEQADARWHTVELRWARGQVTVEVDDDAAATMPMPLESAVTTLLWGGGAVAREPCTIDIGGFAYGSRREGENPS